MDSALRNPKLAGQILRVFEALTSGRWLTLPELHERTGDPVSSISAQIRHLRKPENGSYTILKRRRGRDESGLFEYRLFQSGEGLPSRAA
jgi:hypothetical protein